MKFVQSIRARVILKFLFSAVFTGVLSFTHAAQAESGSIEVKSFKGANCIYLIEAAGGYREALLKDSAATFTVLDGVDVSDSSAVAQAAKQVLGQAKADLEKSVYENYIRVFKNGEPGLIQFVSALAGKQLTLANDRPAIRAALNEMQKTDTLTKNQVPLDAAILEPLVLWINNRGVKVIVDGENAVMAVGYRDGDIKSDRNFVMAPGQKWKDPSDIYFLKTSGDYLNSIKGDKNALAAVYRTVLELVFKSDTAGLAALPNEAQALVSNLYGILLAEAERARDSGWKAHLWHNALVEAFIDSAIVVESKLIWDGTKKDLVPGKPTGFFGVGLKGSGIGGKTGVARKMFQQKICSAMRKINNPLINKAILNVETQLPEVAGKDVIAGLMTYLNKIGSQNEGKIETADGLIDAYVNFIVVMTENAKAITDEISAQIKIEAQPPTP